MEFLYFLSSSIGGAMVVGACVYLSKSYVGARIEQSIRHEYDRKLVQFQTDAEHMNQLTLERLRSDFVVLHSTQSAAFNALSEGHRISHSRRLDAIETLWSELVALKDNTPPIFVNFDILVKGEYSILLERKEERELVEEAVRSLFVNNVNEVAVQNARLFSGEDLYIVFFSYRQILGRILVQLQFGLERENLVAWYEESGMKQILCATFSDEELTTITKTELNTLSRALQLLELRFLNTAAGILSGREAAINTVDYISDILTVASNLDAENARN